MSESGSISHLATTKQIYMLLIKQYAEKRNVRLIRSKKWLCQCPAHEDLQNKGH